MIYFISKNLLLGVFILSLSTAKSQTDVDGIMMAKRNLCSEVTYSQASWNHYWEGSFFRINENLGKVSTTSIGIMSNYGISDRFNILFGLPYVSTKATAGTLHPMKGIQDLSFAAKYKFLYREIKDIHFSFIGVAGVSAPMSKYTPDFLPLSIGLHSKTASARVILDAEYNDFFATLCGAYIYRSNVQLDRKSYYTTELHNTDMVQMPNVWNSQLRVGYRKDQLLLEIFADKMNTMGGFDIRKNDMPFVSNNMDATKLGAHIKIPIPKTNGLGLVGSSAYTVKGRNVGQTFQYMAGLFYIAEFREKGAAK